MPIESIDRSAEHVGEDSTAAPHIVIRGETIYSYQKTEQSSFENNISIIDYLPFTLRPEEAITEEFPLKDIITSVFNIPLENWKYAKSGWNGYKHKINLDEYGFLAFGGASQNNTIHVQIKGQGCKLIQDWLAVYTWGTTHNCKITRIDLAHDDYQGKVINIESAIEWYEQGLFSTNGRPPSRHMYDDFGSGAGKTFYVGKRENGKMIRIYEKGKQLGDTKNPWCRAEVEFHNKDRVLDWDMTINPDPYLSGSYKALSFLSEQQSIIKTLSKEKTICFNKALAWGLSTCGQLINLLCILNNEDYEAVIKLLRRPGIPKKLEPYFKAELKKRGITP